MSAEAWTILGTGGALFVGLAGLAVAIWRSLDARLELMAQQQATGLRGDLRDLRAERRPSRPCVIFALEACVVYASLKWLRLGPHRGPPGAIDTALAST